MESNEVSEILRGDVWKRTSPQTHSLSLSSQERECKSVVVVEESLLHRDTLYDTVYLAHSKRYQYLVGDDDDDEIHFDTLTHSP